MRKSALLNLLLVSLLLAFVPATAQVRPPAQPIDGPGGKQLAHASVTKNHYDTGGLEYWLFEPDSPRPRTAPVIVFLHGWGGTNPAGYGAWLDHLVRRGNIVIFPRYQVDRTTPFPDFTPNTIAAIKAALARLQSETGQVRPQLDKFAVVGHSVGGLLTANVAAMAADSGLPKVRAMMSVEPAPTWSPLRMMNVELADLAKIPSTTLLLAVAGDNDQLAGDGDAKRVFKESTQVPAANKDFITLVSDAHGQPKLDASHFAPVALDQSYDDGERGGRQVNANSAASPGPASEDPSADRRTGRAAAVNAADTGRSTRPSGGSRFTASVDALDYFGLWKLFDALCDTAFYGRNRQYALGNTPQQRFMGKWSDGTPVKELRITDRP